MAEKKGLPKSAASSVSSSPDSEQGFGRFGPSSFSKDEEIVLVSWNSEEGLARLARSQLNLDYYQLANYFQPQINPLYCGIATAVIILNSLRLPEGKAPSQKQLEVSKPEVVGGDVIPFHGYSQTTLLNRETDRIKPRARINLENLADILKDPDAHYNPGLSLAELKGVLEVYGLWVELFYAEMELEEGTTQFRDMVKSILPIRDQFVVVNFIGKEIGAATGGHISPLGAYDEQSDSVLILDVAGHKNPWYWVPISHLYQSMHMKVGEGHRGWLVVTEPKNDVR